MDSASIRNTLSCHPVIFARCHLITCRDNCPIWLLCLYICAHASRLQLQSLAWGNHFTHTYSPTRYFLPSPSYRNGRQRQSPHKQLIRHSFQGCTFLHLFHPWCHSLPLDTHLRHDTGMGLEFSYPYSQVYGFCIIPQRDPPPLFSSSTTHPRSP